MKYVRSKISVFIFIICLFFVSQVFATPMIIAHRGGKQNYPENTILAFTKALENGADALELDVQVTQDGIVVVYHPEKLSQWTNGIGTIASNSYEYISKLDAAYNYNTSSGCPLRGKGLYVPSLQEVLETFPNIQIILDLKSLPAEPLIEALVQTISGEESKRLIFYSTDSEHIDLIKQMKPNWTVFEKRDFTRQKLLDLNQTGKTNIPFTSHYMGFELKRNMTVIETFALGKGVSEVQFYLWNPMTITSIKETDPEAFVVLFGINTPEDWNSAIKLNVDAVYTDNPLELSALKRLR